MTPLIEVKQLTKRFNRSKAVDAVSLNILKGETLGVVGESGCGKSTLGRCLLRLETASSGEILFEGKDILTYSKQALFDFRRRAQSIFQDPYASLNPRMTAAEIIAEGPQIHNCPIDVALLAQKVGLSPTLLSRFPHEFSGGQRQRIGIARALALSPDFLVCDEPTSALDVPVQAQIINLLKDLQRELSLTYLFITHNLAIARYVSDRIAVMYAGSLVEVARADNLFKNPLHPYTEQLLSAILKPLAERTSIRVPKEPIPHEIPSQGCRFALRCPHAQPLCRLQKPELVEVAPEHFVACHLYRAQEDFVNLALRDKDTSISKETHPCR
jgi:oligopeptide transport system ATP-binding protein